MASYLIIVPKDKRVTEGDLRRMSQDMFKIGKRVWFDSRTLWKESKYYFVGYLEHDVSEIEETLRRILADRGQKGSLRVSQIAGKYFRVLDSEWMPNADFVTGIGRFDRARYFRRHYAQRLINEAREMPEPVEVVAYSDETSEIALWTDPEQAHFLVRYAGDEIARLPFSSDTWAIIGWFYGKIRDIEKERI